MPDERFTRREGFKKLFRKAQQAAAEAIDRAFPQPRQPKQRPVGSTQEELAVARARDRHARRSGRPERRRDERKLRKRMKRDLKNLFPIRDDTFEENF